MGKRMQGRAGQVALKRRRAAHPFCAHCLERGIYKPTAQIDHIQALALGGEDVDENVQGLCLMCHAVKTAMEDATGGGASNHPDWLRPARGTLAIVTGPPCAGKSTLVREQAGERDMVIDLDVIAEQVQPGFARRWTGELLNQCIRVRNSLLGSLSTIQPSAVSWFIVGAPTIAEREWWRGKLDPARMIHLDPGYDECMRRANARPSPKLEADKVAEWYELSRTPWRAKAPRPRKVAIGEDGYPIL